MSDLFVHPDQPRWPAGSGRDLGLPPCDGDEQMLRVFLAEACLAAGMTLAELMKAQGFDPAPLLSRSPLGGG